MKNLISLVIAVVVSFTVMYGVYVGINKIASPDEYGNEAVGGGVTQGQRYYLTAGTGIATADGNTEATTTKVFLLTTAGGAASSTITGIMERADQIDVVLRAIGSSTASNIIFVRQFSNDNIDWYSMDEATTTNANTIGVVHNTNDVNHIWNLSTSSQLICGTNEVCKHIVLKDGYAKYFRLKFKVTGANAAVWGYAVPRENTPN